MCTSPDSITQINLFVHILACVCVRAYVLAIFLSFRCVVLCILNNVNINYYIKRPFSVFNTRRTLLSRVLWYGTVHTALDLYFVAVFCLYFLYLRYIYLLFLEFLYCAVSVFSRLSVNSAH